MVLLILLKTLKNKIFCAIFFGQENDDEYRSHLTDRYQKTDLTSTKHRFLLSLIEYNIQQICGLCICNILFRE